MIDIFMEHSNPDLLQQEADYKQTIPIVFATSSKFIPILSVAIQSISEHVDPNYLYHLYVFHSDRFSIKKAQKIQETIAPNICISFVNVSDYIKELLYSIPEHFHFCISIETYFRLFIPLILQEYDKVIYLDTDLIVLTDIRHLYNIDIGKALIAGVVEFLPEPLDTYVKNNLHLDTSKYINGGVQILNCNELNAYNFKEKFLTYLSCGMTLMLDQDLMNKLCEHRIYYLDDKWNYRWHQGSTNLSEIEIPYILHYLTSIKPWKQPSLLFSKYFYHYASLTLFSNEILKISKKT
ncbi:MAG: glycosyltransferase family 8 protein [bacterium]|nr:glycosyltransferase family 8 protein [bacterium]